VPIDVLFAGIAVSDLDASVGWYEQLLGRPADILVNPDEVMWRIGDAAWLYLVRDAHRAGHGLAAFAVPDLEAAIAEIARRGLVTERIEIVGTAGRKAPLVDLDGNTISLIEVVASTD